MQVFQSPSRLSTDQQEGAIHVEIQGSFCLTVGVSEVIKYASKLGGRPRLPTPVS